MEDPRSRDSILRPTCSCSNVVCFHLKNSHLDLSFLLPSSCFALSNPPHPPLPTPSSLVTLHKHTHIIPTFSNNTSSPLDLSAQQLLSLPTRCSFTKALRHIEHKHELTNQTHPGTIRLTLLELIRYTEPLIIDRYIYLSFDRDHT